MSNGTPETFEGGPEGPPSRTAVVAIVYAVAWILGALFALLFGWPALTSRTWIVVLSAVLFATSLAVLAREIGFSGSASKGKPQ